MIPAFVTTLGGYYLTLRIPWAKYHDVKIDFTSNTLSFESQYCLNNCVNDVNMAYGIEEELPHFLLAYAAQCALGHKVLDKDEVLQRVLKLYHESLPLFVEKTEDQLPLPGRFDDEIPLRLGFVPPCRQIYGLSPPEPSALSPGRDENFDQKFICESSSPAPSPILFVKKKECSLHLCVDYREISKGTSNNRDPLPLIKENTMQLSRAKILTKLHMCGAYNLNRMRAVEEWKRGFHTQYGLFEYLVIPFGLTNAPQPFQRTLTIRYALFCIAFVKHTLTIS